MNRSVKPAARWGVLAAFGCSLLVLAGCGGGGGGTPATPTPTPPPASTERLVLPQSTDPAVSASLAAHVAINPQPGVTAKRRLFVFLPGTFADPALYRTILRTGAAQGYHAIGLSYPNDQTVASRCQGNADADCIWNARREVVTGVDVSPVIAVPSADSIVNLTGKLLAWLHAQYPSEGWGDFLVGGAVDWSRVVVAGHSQGGGHAVAMGKLFPLLRGVFFSSLADTNPAAPWLARPGATPVERQYGFTHQRDALVPYDQALAVWNALGLAAFGAPYLVDGAAPPASSSRQWVTNVQPNESGGSPFPVHGATVVDNATPLAANGTPVLAPVWIALCFP
jgi:hypothetical protein